MLELIYQHPFSFVTGCVVIAILAVVLVQSWKD